MQGGKGEQVSETDYAICADCGRPKGDGIHARYGADLNNPMKHEFVTTNQPAPQAEGPVTPQMMSEVFAETVHTTDREHQHIYDHRIAAKLLNKKLAHAEKGQGDDCINCEKLIAERDAMEERVNSIAVALELTEEEATWSNLNDPAERCIEKIAALRQSQGEPGDTPERLAGCDTQERFNDYTAALARIQEASPDELDDDTLTAIREELEAALRQSQGEPK